MRTRPPQPMPSHADVVVDSEQRVWSGRFPLDVIAFRHRRFDNTMSAQRKWELWRRGPAAALIPYDPVADAVVLIEQFRLPALAAGVDPMLVELPAGLCDDGEDPAATICRELHEEMHLKADRMQRIGGFLLTPGGADEFCHLYAGRVTAPVADADGLVGYAGEVLENEDIRIRVWSATDAIQAAFAGRFCNVVTSLGLFWLNSRREALREEWTTR